MELNRMDRFRGILWLLPALLMWASVANAQKETESVDKYRVVYEYTAPVFEGGDTEGVVMHISPAVPLDSMGVRYSYPPALAHLIDLHKRTNEATIEGKGFRIQIYAGSKMEIANEAKADFIQSFHGAGMEVYKDWEPPHFWVRVGDFLSRNEAMRQLPNVKAIFPDAFVVADKINMPKYKKAIAHPPLDNKELSPEGQQD
jgi:hypothetical protein